MVSIKTKKNGVLQEEGEILDLYYLYLCLFSADCWKPTGKSCSGWSNPVSHSFGCGSVHVNIHRFGIGELPVPSIVQVYYYLHLFISSVISIYYISPKLDVFRVFRDKAYETQWNYRLHEGSESWYQFLCAWFFACSCPVLTTRSTTTQQMTTKIEDNLPATRNKGCACSYNTSSNTGRYGSPTTDPSQDNPPSYAQMRLLRDLERSISKLTQLATGDCFMIWIILNWFSHFCLWLNQHPNFCCLLSHVFSRWINPSIWAHQNPHVGRFNSPMFVVAKISWDLHHLRIWSAALEFSPALGKILLETGCKYFFEILGKRKNLWISKWMIWGILFVLNFPGTLWCPPCHVIERLVHSIVEKLSFTSYKKNTSLRVIPTVTSYWHIFVTNPDILCAKIWRGREGEDNSDEI